MTARELKALRELPLEDLAARRAELKAAHDAVYGILLDRTLEEADDGNVTAVARRAGIARATVYNELERRQAVA